MKCKAVKTKLEAVLSLRNLFLRETNFQIRYNACHERGWTASYLLIVDGREVGYGSVNGQEIKNRDTIFEFFLVPPYRKLASRIFPELIAASAVKLIECQSNDFLLTSMLYEFTQNIRSEVVLFEDHVVTEHTIPGVVFRPRKKGEIIKHNTDPGDYLLELDREIVATGGFLLHYNMPFADLYMEVREDSRRKGLGNYLLQEIKKECYLAGRVPAARCQIENPASRATLRNAGLKECGFMLVGDIKEMS